jgi:hypothetical protein
MICGAAGPKIDAAVLDAKPSFAPPPLWIHESLAARCVLGKESPLLISRRREAKRRALLQMLDRIPIRSERPTALPQPAAAPADVPLPRSKAGFGDGARTK